MTWLETAQASALALALLTTNQHTGHAAEYRTISQGVVGLRGPIDADDARRLTNIISSGLNRGVPLQALVLEWSNGGNTDSSMAMAVMLKQRRIATRAIGICWSACATIFAGGYTRSVSQNAQVCVHSARDPNTQAGGGAGENALSKDTTIELARFFYEQLDAPYSVVGKLVATPPSRVTCLDRSDYDVWQVYVH